ncbi:unnamed protein product [Wuchereria bancrofti]|uniref:Uncharacterized protein n=2 Tax=Wuchereria bancrofti TaxID=6293 RepID=A0A3P7E5D1_WUCBA|nr:unnamed protein product [Wuchereria bancrofti]
MHERRRTWRMNHGARHTVVSARECDILNGYWLLLVK